MLTQSKLKEVLNYDPLTGLFTWMISPRSMTRIGDAAGCASRGYIVIGVLGVQYLSHRLAFLYMNGRWPSEIDHINGIKADNRWLNLREATRTTNMQNRRGPNKNNKVGFLGVSKDKSNFQAQIKTDGIARHLGNYKTPELAHEAYIEAKRKLHPFGTI